MQPPTHHDVHFALCIDCARIHCPVHLCWDAEGNPDDPPASVDGLPRWSWLGDAPRCDAYVPGAHVRARLAIGELFGDAPPMVTLPEAEWVRDLERALGTL